MRFLSELGIKRASSRHITSSTDGCERMARSEPSSWGPAQVTMGYTVNLQPQPFTEPSLVNFQRNSSPGRNKTIDQKLALSIGKMGYKNCPVGYFQTSTMVIFLSFENLNLKTTVQYNFYSYGKLFWQYSTAFIKNLIFPHLMFSFNNLQPIFSLF